MWTPRATSTTTTWQDTHKLAWGKDNRANQNPQKSVFTSMYTKRVQGATCQETVSVWHACMSACMHTQLMSVVHGTRVGTTKLKVQPVTGSSFPMETN